MYPTSSPAEALLLPAEAAAELGITRRELLERASAGDLPGVLIGGQHWRFSRARLRAAMRHAARTASAAA